MHLAGADFPLVRNNPLSVSGWRALFERARRARRQRAGGAGDFIARELDHLDARWPADLPLGVIHGDLFPDNVFFLGEQAVGSDRLPVLAATDILAYDVAVLPRRLVLRAAMHSFNVTKAARRLLTCLWPDPATTRAAEQNCAARCWRRGAALRFLLTRLIDCLNVPPGALVKPQRPCWNMSASCGFHARRVKPASAILTACDAGGDVAALSEKPQRD